MTEPALIAHDSRDGMADALAEQIAKALREAVARRGQAGLIVSGGSTPTVRASLAGGSRLVQGHDHACRRALGAARE